ncbi:ornithine cyclodeaminase (plasmid) [Rhizobium leguminosarum]|nr:ornithine cyclodeaminase [Rhizobium leguminosarum]TBF70677.1 ornithine cyclodeaminase [Rhizobium leguminosarum]TBG93452.1 ornithine cyclodeaminase [Rhizobium leguminosarum]TBG95927.1 ornithine cyclodeaminase [Rhizobium leguminosarum]TBH28831.1 ornithine cyclodeaminase [Rhizobium leguminosarum]TBH50277.1 ornithine cyclodeaminase [Rhizobium leguminosarum]
MFLKSLSRAAVTWSARHLAPKGTKTIAIIGNGAQAEFQALAMKAVIGIEAVQLYDVDPKASAKTRRNLVGFGLDVKVCETVHAAVEGAGIITTCTADKQYATILTDNMVGSGIHINAIGGDCPGKTELHKDILLRADTFVEYPPQTWIEGEIQQMSPDYPITELWRVVTGEHIGRRDDKQVTLFDSVGFAIEGLTALSYVREKPKSTGLYEEIDIIADPDEPRDLFGMLQRAKNRAAIR